MSNIVGTFTIGSTGVITINSLGFNPSELEFEVGAKSGSSASITRCSGWVDSAGNQGCKTSFNDGTNRTANDYTNKCILVWEYSGGSWSVVLEANFHSYVAGGFKLNSVTSNTNYPVTVKART